MKILNKAICRFRLLRMESHDGFHFPVSLEKTDAVRTLAGKRSADLPLSQGGRS